MPRFNRRHIIIAIAISFFLLSKSASAEGPKRRIVSLTPASTEILFALGLDEEIVGVSSFCNWPAEASEKEKIGSFSSPDIEKIILLKPDLVILTGMEQEYFKTTLHSLRIDYIIVDPPDLEELFVSIAKIADATGKNKEADILIKGIKEQIYKIKKRLSNISDQDRPKVYLEIWHDPIMSAGRDSFVNDMIEKAGGVNITSGLGRSFSRVDPEWIIFSNPNVIILSYMKAGGWIKENFVKRIGWGRIDAVKNSRIYADINPDIILRPGPRVKEGLLELHKRFYEN